MEWLGEVPEGWGVDRLKRSITSCRNGIWGGDAQGNEEDIPCVRVADFDRPRLRVELMGPTIRNVTVREREGRMLKRGNLLLEKSGGGENQPVGYVVLYDDEREAVCSNFIAKVQIAKAMVPSFWRYVHHAAYSVRLNTRSIKQTSGIQNLDDHQYFDERAVFPSYAEQQTIAAFLDRETDRIDTLIAKKTRFIELLKEKRQAVITHAVTKGLDDTVPMKDSGVKWLGMVPAQWTVLQLRRITTDRCDGPFGSGLKSDHYHSEGVRVVRLQNIGWASFKNDDAAYITFEHWQDSLGGGHEVLADDLLIAGLGDENNPLGRACVAPSNIGTAIVKADCYRFRLDQNKALTEFVSLALSATARAECGFLATGATRDRLNLGLASARRIALPPRQEQEKIVENLKANTNCIDLLILKSQRSIDLLKEHRAALITAAVTGKIDVREAA